MTKEYYYETSVSWKRERLGELTTVGMPTIEVATPPEFKGHHDIWTPEHLFVASVEICVMTTFLGIAERADLKFHAYRSQTKGTLARDENRKHMITKIEIYPEISVGNEESKAQALEVIKQAEENCLISNSMKTKVVVTPRVIVS